MFLKKETIKQLQNFLCLKLDVVLILFRNSTPKEVAYIWENVKKCYGIIVIKIERQQIHF